jgi:hypothetical protein
MSGMGGKQTFAAKLNERPLTVDSRAALSVREGRMTAVVWFRSNIHEKQLSCLRKNSKAKASSPHVRMVLGGISGVLTQIVTPESAQQPHP